MIIRNALFFEQNGHNGFNGLNVYTRAGRLFIGPLEKEMVNDGSKNNNKYHC